MVMVRFEAPIHWLFVTLVLGACGASAEPAPQTSAAPAPAGTTPAEGSAEGPVGADAAPLAEDTAPPPEPLQPDSDGIRAALIEASRNGAALVRIIDPERGIGAWDRTDETKAHFCDSTRLGREPALGFGLDNDYEWRCDDELSRCSAVDPTDASGAVFYFREAEGGGRWLDTIVRYGLRVPRLDSEHVTAFVEAGDGVCELFRHLTASAEELSTEKLSVFVSRFTDGVEENTTERHCADEASAAVRTQLADPMQIGPPTVCSRQPVSCAWLGAEEIRVYGRSDGSPYGVAHLGTHLIERQSRQQEREVAAFAQRAALPRCN